MKLASWNVNGLRSSWNKGLLNYIKKSEPDVLCLQEIKIQEFQLTEEQRHPLKKYTSIWNPAQKPGYSGVGIYSKREPSEVFHGIGWKEADAEGRVLGAVFSDVVILSAYFPNSQRDHARLPFKLRFNEKIHEFCNAFVKKGKHIILCGDFNVAHKEIDLKNPKSNTKNAGFLPEERQWMDEFLNSGYVDTFREKNKERDQYTWWSYRPGVREKNVGWRIDYQCVNREFRDRVSESRILPKVLGSDHCPIEIEVVD